MKHEKLMKLINQKIKKFDKNKLFYVKVRKIT